MAEIHISRCPSVHRQQALELALRGLAPDQAGPLVASLGKLVDQGIDVFHALAIATKGGELYGAGWVQPLVGRVATLWLPQFTSRASRDMERRLAAFALQAARSLPIELVQTLIEPERSADGELLEQLGFRRLAELQFLHWDLRAAQPAATIDPDLTFHPCANQNRPLLKRLLAESYHETLDCPQLEGLRQLDDTIDGYQSVGNHVPDLWWTVHWREEPVGVVLLNPYGDSSHWELVYMGISPAARGRGLGRQLLEKIRQEGSRAGVEQVLLAVDADNWPARRIYEAAGFRPWGARLAYLQPFSDRG